MSGGISIYDYPGQIDAVQAKLDALRQIDAAECKTGMAKELAKPHRRGWSWKNLHALWRKWEASGRDSAVLLDRAKIKSLQKAGAPSLPDEFLAWVGGLMLGNQRKSKPAYRRLIVAWEKWRQLGERAAGEFPGYAECPPDCGKGYPEGWSYRNLMAKAQPPAEELAMARVGSVAAQEHLPFIPGTREGVRFLEWVFFDDVWQDRQVIAAGQPKPVRLLQLGGLDLATGVYLKFGMRPDLTLDDGTRERLKRKDFLYLVASILLEYGWPIDYRMHLVVERATATMSLAEAEFLHDISEGQIVVGYTSMEGRFVAAWEEGKSGNPRGKACLESWHNLFHNEMASLPGQVGKDRDHRPAALYGSDREAIAVQKLSLVAGREAATKIRSPYPSVAQAFRETLAVVDRINRRTDHRLEGFDEVAVWSIPELDTPWKTGVPAERFADAAVWRSRPQSPVERLAALSEGVRFTRPHPGAMVRFYEDNHEQKQIERRQVKITTGGKTFWFGPEDPMDALPNGTPVTVHFAPFDPEYALVTSKGKFIGVWQRQLVRRGDADELAESIRRKQSFISQTASHVRGKMYDTLVKQDARLSANIDELEAADVIPSAAGQSRAQHVQTERGEVAKAMQIATETIGDEARRKTAAAVRILKASGSIDDMLPTPAPPDDGWANEADDTDDGFDDLL